MPVGVYKVEYQIAGGDILPATLLEDGRYWFPVPLTADGYVVVGVWVWDYALNVHYDTYWYWLQGGHIKSVQLVSDGRFRLTMRKDHLRMTMRDREYQMRMARNGYGLIFIPREYIVRKHKDQRIR